MRTPGFSLIEVLTAVVIMGLLVATVVPLQRRLMARQATIEEFMVANGVLEAWVRTQTSWRVGEHPVMERSEWYVMVEELHADQSLLLLETPRRWFRVVMHRRSDQAVLAESRIVALAQAVVSQ